MRKTVLVSDLTGAEITEHAVIRLSVGDDVWLLDANRADEVVGQLMTAGSKQKKRGRKPKAA